MEFGGLGPSHTEAEMKHNNSPELLNLLFGDISRKNDPQNAEASLDFSYDFPMSFLSKLRETQIILGGAGAPPQTSPFTSGGTCHPTPPTFIGY